MPITVTCPICDATFTVKESFAGKRGECPDCGEPITVPDRPMNQPRKRRKTLPVVLVVIGIVFLLCGSVATGIYFNLVHPLVEQARQKELTDNLRVHRQNLARLREGMTFKEVQEVLGNGSNPTEVEVVSATEMLSDSDDAERRWVSKQRLGHVLKWQCSNDRILVAFSHDPNSGGTVVGVLGALGSSYLEGSEPVKLPAESGAPTPNPNPNPVDPKKLPCASEATLDATRLAKNPAEYEGRWVVVTGKVKTGMAQKPGEEGTAWEGVSLEQEGPPVRFAGSLGPSPSVPPFVVGDVIEVWGQVYYSAGDGSVMVEKCLLLSPAVEVDAVRLLEEFTADPEAAEKRYRGKALKVSGVARKEFTRMKIESKSDGEVVLAGSSGLNEQFKVRAGDRVTVLVNQFEYIPGNEVRGSGNLDFHFDRLLSVSR